ncbi:hypothetical protein PCANC_12974 [Puccinia coronata f. sp. avenae]|uniref:Uncharacterized protein n=1 Tax=Puccinia coronata f. sp. avenae TaxID=200324 RepID=A0A2N5UNF9_9BASI|nr:hypothetical protein PCANC_12974 [Puccinia coronata f. sp. avenae]PLW39295.1 hypothetical protein PCASD_05343 [Puccinia coronata f. sp. avenae]
MPLRSKQPSRKTKSSSNKTKARLHQKSSSPIEQTPDPSAGEQQEEEEEDQSSDEEAPRLNMKNLLKTLENQSKQKLAKKQNKIFQEIESAQRVLVDRLDEIIQSQESELEEMVSGFLTAKAQIEEQKENLTMDIISQQQCLQSVLESLEDNMEEHLEKVHEELDSTIQQISQLDRQRKRKAREFLNTQ